MLDLFGENQVFHAIPWHDVLSQASESRTRTFAGCGPNGFLIGLFTACFGFCAIENRVQCCSAYRIEALRNFCSFVGIPISFGQNSGPRVSAAHADWFDGL